MHKETVVACARVVTEGRVGELGAAYLDRRDKTKVASVWPDGSQTWVTR